MEAILELQLDRLRERLAERRITLEVAEAARAVLLAEGWSPEFGARELRRVIQRRLTDPIATALLQGRLDDGGLVRAAEDPERSNDLELFATSGPNHPWHRLSDGTPA